MPIWPIASLPANTLGGKQEPTGRYHAGPGTAHEVGLVNGFMAAFVLVIVAYLVM